MTYAQLERMLRLLDHDPPDVLALRAMVTHEMRAQDIAALAMELADKPCYKCSMARVE